MINKIILYVFHLLVDYQYMLCIVNFVKDKFVSYMTCSRIPFLDALLTKLTFDFRVQKSELKARLLHDHPHVGQGAKPLSHCCQQLTSFVFYILNVTSSKPQRETELNPILMLILTYPQV